MILRVKAGPCVRCGANTQTWDGDQPRHPTCIPVKKDTAPPEFVKMARTWLYDADLPAGWEDSVAQEFDAAIADRKLEIVSTCQEGRPIDVAVVDWQART